MRETTTSTHTIDVNGTRLIPNGLFRGADTFGVGSQTIVLGSTIATKASIRRAERRAPKLLRHHKAESGRQSSSRSRGNV